MTLLEKALAVNRKRQAAKPLNVEELDLYLAWLHGRIGTVQVFKALGSVGPDTAASAKVLYRIASALRIAVSDGLITIKKEK